MLSTFHQFQRNYPNVCSPECDFDKFFNEKVSNLNERLDDAHKADYCRVANQYLNNTECSNDMKLFIGFMDDTIKTEMMVWSILYHQNAKTYFDSDGVFQIYVPIDTTINATLKDTVYRILNIFKNIVRYLRCWYLSNQPHVIKHILKELANVLVENLLRNREMWENTPDENTLYEYTHLNPLAELNPN